MKCENCGTSSQIKIVFQNGFKIVSCGCCNHGYAEEIKKEGDK